MLFRSSLAAWEIGAQGQRTARERFNLTRFASDWTEALHGAIALAPVNGVPT